jgi:hypothetical protein
MSRTRPEVLILIGIVAVCAAVILFLVLRKKDKCEECKETTPPDQNTKKTIFMKSNGTIELKDSPTAAEETFINYIGADQLCAGDAVCDGIQFDHNTDLSNKTSRDMLFDLLSNKLPSNTTTKRYSEANEADVKAVADDILKLAKNEPDDFSHIADRAFRLVSSYVSINSLTFNVDGIIMIDFAQMAQMVLFESGLVIKDLPVLSDGKVTLKWAGTTQNTPVHLALIGVLGIPNIEVTSIQWETPFPVQRRTWEEVTTDNSRLSLFMSKLFVTTLIDETKLARLMYESQIETDDTWPDITRNLLEIQRDVVSIPDISLWNALVSKFNNISLTFNTLAPTLKVMINAVQQQT